MIAIYKKSNNSENSARELEIMNQKDQQLSYQNKRALKSYYSLIDVQETINEKITFFKKSRSEFQINHFCLRNKKGNIQDQSFPLNHFQNLFDGCKNWNIHAPKISLKKKSTTETQSMYSIKNNFQSQKTLQQVQRLVENEQNQKALILDYDQDEWFDTDCSEYESELN